MGDKEDPDKLNVFSRNFDALAALYADNIVLPWAEAPAFDNVAKYEALAKTTDGTESMDKVQLRFNKLAMKKLEEKKAGKLVRELPIPSTSKQADEVEKSQPKVEEDADGEDRAIPKMKKKFENVVTLAAKMEGPLGFLKNCMHHRVRLKVVTRKRASIRGYCMGFVVAFDRHWNIALEDVTEVWTRKVKRKTIPLGIPTDPPEEWIQLGQPPYLPPPIRIIERKGRKETCERYVKQLMLRGENVVLVSVASPLQKLRTKASTS